MDAKAVMIAAVLVVQPLALAAQEPRGPQGGAGTVTLTRTDYDRLLDLAGRRPPGPDNPPVPAALTRAEIRVRVNGTIARASMQVDGEVFRNGTVKVPLLKGATLLDARTADRPLPWPHVARLNRFGVSILDLATHPSNQAPVPIEPRLPPSSR